MNDLFLWLPLAIGVAVFVALIKRIELSGLANRFRYVFANLHSEVGAVTLTQSALMSQNDLQRGVVETFIQTSSVLDRLPLIPIEGNAYAYNEEATLPGVEFRAVNSAYTESTGTVNQRTETLVILGGDADVDKFIAQTRGNLNDQREVQTRLKVKAVNYKFQDAFINGDTAVDANSFDGLKKRLTGAQIIDAATNGLPVIGASATDQHAFLDRLDETIAAVDGQVDALYMNASIRAKIRSSARRLGGWDQYRMEDFGKLIETYNGIPMLDIGKKADGTMIIPQTETQGSSSVASSIYAVAFSDDEAEAGTSGFFNSSDGPDQPIMTEDLSSDGKTLESKPVFRVRVEFYCGLGVFGKGAARLRGVLNS